jgi:hypothetical protein
MWNSKSVRGERKKWPKKIDEWFGTHSLDFDDLQLESVHGKIFNRYPGLFFFEAKNRKKAKFNFYLVPLHLKAMGEGNVRRQMASEILAAAIGKMIADGADADWVVGGDYNAELASGDFNALLKTGRAISATDEGNGSFSYVKSPKSLIDHIYLSANLAQTYDDDSFFIVAADRTIPKYTKKISDHRPVLVRLSLLPQHEEARGTASPEAIAELRSILGAKRPPRPGAKRAPEALA